MARTVLITGAGRGLGLALAREYLGQGARVLALNRGSGPDALRLAADHPDRLVVLECDVSKERQVREAAGQVTAVTASIDLLINNAALHLEKPFTEANEWDADVVRATLDVNAVGPLLVVKHFLPFILAGGGKTIVNVSSEAGSLATCTRDREYGYCMSKAALNMLSVILQNRVRGAGVKVLAIHPGWLRTDMGGAGAQLDPQVVAREMAATIERSRPPGGPIFVDHAGTPMPW